MARNPAVADLLSTVLRTKARGFQRELAEKLGTTQASISRWASGQSSPDPAEWPAIEAALGLDEGSLATAAFGMSPAMVSRLLELPEQIASLTARMEAVEAALSRGDHPAGRVPTPKVVPIERPLRKAAKKKTPRTPD